MATSPKITIYSTPDLKNTTDDALPTYLNSLKFQQSHTYTDTRLILGYTAVAISGVIFYLDYTQGWDATKELTLYAVVAYFLLNSALTYWIWGVEAGCIFAGSKDGDELHLSTRAEKYDPTYYVRAKYRSSKAAGAQWQTKDIQAPFTRWFDEDGHFVALPFQCWLANELAVVGKADPGKVGKGEGAEALVGLDEAVSSARAPDTQTKGSRPKRR